MTRFFYGGAVAVITFTAPLFLLLACVEDSPTGESARKMMMPGSMGAMTGGQLDEEANASSPADQLSLADACALSCNVQRTCGLPTPANCSELCEQGGLAFTGSCRDMVVKDAQCLSGLSCDEFTDYAEGRRGHAQCGDNFSQFLDSCVYKAGEVAECTAFCQALAGCAISGAPKRAACEENCALVLTGLELVGGKDCAVAQEEGYACMAAQGCEELQAALTAGVTPNACTHLDSPLRAACQ